MQLISVPISPPMESPSHKLSDINTGSHVRLVRERQSSPCTDKSCHTLLTQRHLPTILFFFFLKTPRPPSSTLFPHPTLFRSRVPGRMILGIAENRCAAAVTRDDVALGHGRYGVVGPLAVHVGPERREQRAYVRLGKNDDEIGRAHV